MAKWTRHLLSLCAALISFAIAPLAYAQQPAQPRFAETRLVPALFFRVIKLADGTWLVGDYAEGAASSNSTVFLETEFPIATIRWLNLDISRVVTRGTWVEKPDLSRVDEIGFADLTPGSGHGWGGFVNVGRIEVYGRSVKR